MPLKTLLLNPPSFENFDGGASSRWPATREIESYWSPVWLTYPAGLLEGSRLLDAPPQAACSALVRMAIEAGGPDNISVVVARVDGDLPPPTGTPIRFEKFVPKIRTARLVSANRKPRKSALNGWVPARSDTKS